MLVLLAAAAMIAASGDSGWASFSAHHARSGVWVEVSIGTADIHSSPPDYWFRRATRIVGKDDEVVQVDTGQCPALIASLRSLEGLPAPHPAIPFFDKSEMLVTADGVDYSLTVPAAYPDASPDDITLKSNTGTPLADWIEQTLTTLRKCEPADHPVRPGP